MQKEMLIRIGNGNFVIASRVVAILNPASSPMRRLREDAKNEGRLIDATQGKKTRAIIVLDSNHVLLSSVGAETISQRIFSYNKDSQSQESLSSDSSAQQSCGQENQGQDNPEQFFA